MGTINKTLCNVVITWLAPSLFNNLSTLIGLRNCLFWIFLFLWWCWLLRILTNNEFHDTGFLRIAGRLNAGKKSRNEWLHEVMFAKKNDEECKNKRNFQCRYELLIATVKGSFYRVIKYQLKYVYSTVCSKIKRLPKILSTKCLN